ncbi:sulfite exporter TauE/SafE family protein [Streptomyces sp. NPDC048636]|uniref:sulfite exporter TauE/SafE family protein n=1 Tax=Streptomyces sp. NPDC048636 TaxID=3155762 RepID=UPI0034203A84
MEVVTVGLVLVTVLVGAGMQRVTGMGFALVASPFIVLLLGAVHGVILLNGCGVAVSGILAVRSFRDVELRKYCILVLSAALGVLPGALIVTAVSESWLEVVVGMLILVGIGSSLVLTSRVSPDRVIPLGIAGLFSGLMNVTAGVGGPPLGVYGALTRWDHRSFAATMQPVFFTVGCISLIVKLSLSGAPGEPFPPPVWIGVIAVAVVGMMAGGVVERRLTPTAARALLLGLAVLGALTVLIRGVWELALR